MNEREHRKSAPFARGSMKKITTPLDRSDNKVLSDSPKKKKKSERKEKKSKGVFLLARAFSFPVVLFTIARAQHRRSEDHREIKRGKREREKGNRNDDAPRARERQRDERRITLDRRRNEREREVGKKRKRRKRGIFTFLIFAPRARLMNIYISRVRFAL